VNPSRDEVLGLRCYPSVADLPAAPDVVLLAVGHARAEEAFADALAAGDDLTATCALTFDDGTLDHLTNLAPLLAELGVPGTVYVCPGLFGDPYPWSDAAARIRFMTADEVVELSTHPLVEIGSHTTDHTVLGTASAEEAHRVMAGSKERLEQLLGAPVSSFCYPAGAYAPSHVELVRAAGFSVARTVRRHVCTPPVDLLQVATTLQAYRHFGDASVIARSSQLHPLRSWRRWWNWDDLAIQRFEEVLRTGGVFHLWGHSWEIDDHGDWGRLERVLGHVGRRRDVHYIRNGELPETTAAPQQLAAGARR
jgi:peptidoglycan/xylan/chitin deacetylase (PgdA/CDA1 family)